VAFTAHAAVVELAGLLSSLDFERFSHGGRVRGNDLMVREITEPLILPDFTEISSPPCMAACGGVCRFARQAATLDGHR
jgi:hypothetical protein